MQYSYALGACKPQVKVATKQTKTTSVRLIDFPLIILQITKNTTCFVKPYPLVLCRQDIDLPSIISVHQITPYSLNSLLYKCTKHPHVSSTFPYHSSILQTLTHRMTSHTFVHTRTPQIFLGRGGREEKDSSIFVRYVTAGGRMATEAAAHHQIYSSCRISCRVS